MSDLKTVLPLLRAPFSAAAVRFKIQTNPKSAQGSALVVAFIDARLVAERLNHVCPADWSATYREPMEGKSIVCALQVFDVVREDVGFGQDSRDPEMGIKTMYSDAFKRAAVKYGIGAPLYALPKSFVKASDLKNVNGNWYMTPHAESQLRTGYARWLASPAVQDRFGKPIDHGDELATQAAPPPQNFDNSTHVETVERLAREKKLTRNGMGALLNDAGVPAGDDPRTRLVSASIDQLVSIAGHLERVGAPA